MYLCPRCHNEIPKSVKECPFCNFKLKISLGRYQNRELKLHEDVKNRKIIFNQNIINSKFNRIKKIDKIIVKDSFKKSVMLSDISEKQAEILRFKIISKVFINDFKESKSLTSDVKKFYFGYENEINADPSILLSNLNQLFKLLGFEEFSSYYKDILSKNKLNSSSGVKILGYMMYDVLCYKLKNEEDYESKLFYYVNKEKFYREKQIKRFLNQYYKVTGKYYFSKRFDNIIEIHKFSVKQAFEIKEKVLVSIYFTNSNVDIKQRFDNFILKIVKKNKSKSNSRKRKLGSKTSQYTYKRNNEYGVLGDYYK